MERQKVCMIDQCMYWKECCYQYLSIKKSNLLIKNLNLLQRGSIKNSYINLMKYPVGCVKNLNLNKIIQSIQKNIRIIK